MSSAPFVSLELRGLPGWMPLPLGHDVDASKWATEHLTASATGLEPIQTSIGLEGAIEALVSAVRRARWLWAGDVAAPMSFAFQPDPLGPVLALLDMAVFPLEDLPLIPERTLGMALRNGSIIGEVRTAEMEFPWAHAVVHRAAFAPIPDDDDPASAMIVEAASYALSPPAFAGTVVAEAQWPIPEFGDEILAQVETMISRLVLESAQ